VQCARNPTSFRRAGIPARSRPPGRLDPLEAGPQAVKPAPSHSAAYSLFCMPHYTRGSPLSNIRARTTAESVGIFIMLKPRSRQLIQPVISLFRNKRHPPLTRSVPDVIEDGCTLVDQ